MDTLVQSATTRQTSRSESRVTPAEQQQFLSGIKSSKFRDLLNGYIQEVSDVDNVARETEQSLSHWKNEHTIKTKRQDIKPKPGFVIKTKWDTTDKVFVNVCSSEKMPPPLNKNMARDEEKTLWSLPYSLGRERLEKDKGGASVSTFDVCFHPQVVAFAIARADYRHMVITTCLDAVEYVIRDSRSKSTAVLARKYHILKGTFYKSGDPVPMCLGKNHDAMEISKQFKTINYVQVEMKTNVDLSRDKITLLSDNESIMVVRDQADTDAVQDELMHVEHIDDAASLIKEKLLGSDFDPKEQHEKLQQKKTMEHRLFYRGRCELLYDMQAGPGNHVAGDGYRPKELVVEVSFPLFSSAKGINLDVSERMLRLSVDPSVVSDYEPLELALPFSVFEDKGCARFDRIKRELVVTLPVQPLPKPKPQSVSLVARVNDEEEENEQELLRNILATPKSSETFAPTHKNKGEDKMLRETALMVANNPQAMVHNQQTAQRHVPPLKSCGNEEIDTSELRADETESSFSMSAFVQSASEAVDAIKPSLKTHDTLKCLSYIVGVAGIDSVSVKLTFPSNNSLRLQFTDSKKQLYEMHVAICPVTIDPSTAEFDVASENMVVILHKKHG